LFGCDRDGAAIEAARQRLQAEPRFEGRFEIRQGNFADLGLWLPAGSCDGVLLDLGVSSPQLDWPERGFSFQQNGPLDMRMNRSGGVTAAVLLNEASAEELARIFWEYGDEHESRRIARAIELDRRACPFRTTRQLAELMERLRPRQGRKAHPATKVFQALRIAVNDEIGSLKRGLEAALGVLKPGGRLAVITFHSLEDRVVKDFGQRRSRPYLVLGEVDIPELRQPREPELRWVARKAIGPTAAEIERNPRARSAQLRVFEKLYAA
jgi:16S rRNA (cytosine1402-N4)-methyltransferase